MTIQEEFFKTFGIEPKYKCANKNAKGLEYECTDGDLSKFKTCKDVNFIYPEITDRILFELICIMNRYSENAGFLVFGENIKDVKKHILKLLIINFPLLNDINIKQVRNLFEVQ